AGGSELYVLSRGNGAVLRINQMGQLVAMRRVSVGGEVLGARRLNGIAVSHDAKRIFISVSGRLPGKAAPGALIEIPAFGGSKAASLVRSGSDAASEGARLFQRRMTAADGLGPLYNGDSCAECHGFPTLGGVGRDGLGVVLRVGRFEAGRYDPL